MWGSFGGDEGQCVLGLVRCTHGNTYPCCHFGADVLPDDQKLTLEIARVIRVGFLQQNAFHADDTFVSLQKQQKMMRAVLYLYQKAGELVAQQVPLSKLQATGLFDKAVKLKYDVPNSHIELLDDFLGEVDRALSAIRPIAGRDSTW